MKKFLIRFWPQIVLTVLIGALFILNYVPGTRLLGWDSLQTELNPGLAVKRAIFSVWEEYQSFGLPAGMAHAADIVRAVFIYILALILPDSIVRYTFHVLMLLLASLGAFYLFLHVFKTRGIAFLGACFYLFNFYLIQMFFLPFEPFSIFTAILPWNILMFFKILEQGFSVKNTLKLTALSILSTPAFLAQQVFVVLMLILGALGLGKVIQERSLLVIKRGLLFVGIILVINSFWILPQIYFLKDNGSVTVTSKINQLSTEDILVRNQDKGNIFDFAKNQGFFYESTGLNQQPLFAIWKNYRETLPLQVIIYALFGLTLFGLLKKSPYRLPFILAYVIIVIGLLNYTPGIKQINDLIRLSSFVNQVFRSPFTKFAIPAALVLSYFFCAGVLLLAQLLASRTQKKNLVYTIVSVVALALVFAQAVPAFQGNYFSPEMKVKMPDEYNKLFTYFKTQDKNARIALLPEYTFWGWLYQKWGYDGSGFMWYGIEQPIVSRNFDMWSKNSENYFWEAKDALEGEDIAAYNKVLQKYNISYIILDESLAPVISSMKSIQYDRLESLLANDPEVTLVKKWGVIHVYKVKGAKYAASASTALPNVGPIIKATNKDTAFNTIGSYKTSTQTQPEALYPLLDLTTQTRNNDVEIHESAGTFAVLKKLDPAFSDYKLSTSAGQLTVNLYIDNNPVAFIMPYTVSFAHNILTFQFPKVLLKDYNPILDRSTYCKDNNGALTYNDHKGNLVVTAKNGIYGCANYALPGADQQYGYLVSVGNKNNVGQRLFFSVVDLTKNQPYIEDRLQKDQQYYVIADRFKQGLGYSFYFQASSLKSIPSQNEITNLAAYLIPYNTIKILTLTKPGATITSAKIKQLDFEKKNYYTYIAHLPKNSIYNGVILNQSFDPGWKAYQVKNVTGINTLLPFLTGKEVKDHFIVNNWANGWTVSNVTPPNLIIIFMPQYLEYAGFLLIGGYLVVFGAILLKKRIKRSN